MLRLIGASMLAAVIALVILGGAEAKGPFRVVLSGGDLASPITLDHVDDGAMFGGSGTRLEPPLPYPQFIYTVTVYKEGAEATATPGTISYYPAHDGLPAAFHTRYGFFAVGKDFDSVLRGLLGLPPSHETGGGVSPFWYIAPGLALGLVLVGGVAAVRAVRRRATLRRLTPARS